LMRLSFEVGVDEAMCTIADIIVNEHARSTMGKVNHISFLDDLAVGFEKMVVGVQNGIRERTKGALETKVVRGPGNRRSVAIHVVYPEVQVGL